MQTISRSNFTTVKTEGAILPAGLLQRIADGNLTGLQPQDYHLAPTEKPNEAINRAWNRCLGVWQSFNDQRRKLPTTDSGTSLTRERWLLILFQELGYGRLPFQRRIELEDGTSYPISHLWEPSPIHLLSFRRELDRRDPSIKRSPHSLMQEFLNRSDDHLWGFVSNGLTLRVLRDNVSLTRAAYLEFDLEAMMTGELYADFSLLWLVCHQSRVEIGDKPEIGALPSNCWLETWSQEAAEQGTRALDALHDGVQETIAALGRGFLAHPANAELRRQLNAGELSTQSYYRQLLRLVYRLIFLFVAEDRDLLLVRESQTEEQGSLTSFTGAREKDSPLLPRTSAPLHLPHQRYMQYYSLSRLRRLAEGRRGGPHPDLYRTLRRIFFLLRQGYEPLGLPALGSFLFSERSTPALDEADIANSDLLNAIRALAFTIEGRVRRPVDYKNLGSEELGSVYESLLELHPQLNIAAASFELATAAGSERKTTGSYYTPTSLINSLLDSALEPVVEDRLRQAREQRSGGAGGREKSPLPPGSPAPLPSEAEALEQAILNIKVVDPACGSGHFLIAAGNRLAIHLARVRTGDDEPGPTTRREALRDVVRHCLHGVDINEMSVELCKVALWMETLDPGKPLGFLEANIQCGNSLIGATPALLKEGIPDNAFKPITGDDKKYCSEWKARNKKERGQMVMELDPQPWDRLGDLATAITALDRMGSDTLAGVQAQESSYEKLVRSTPYLYSQFWTDAWCAAFVWPKKPEYQGGYAYPLTEDTFRKIERNPHDVTLWMREEIERLRDQYQFFHWHLAFPHVFSISPMGEGADNEQTGWNGGFDVVLGNPPWERIKLQEKEWFAARDPEITNAPNAAARRKKIAALAKENPTLLADFEADKRKAEGDSAFVRNSERYPLCGRGDVNTYSIFAELSRNIQNSNAGRVGIIVPSGIATDNSTKFFFGDLMRSHNLISLYEFENEGFFGAGQGHMVRFALTTMAGMRQQIEATDFLFQGKSINDLKVEEKHFTLTAQDITLLNPNTRTCPIFQTKRDAELTKSIYRRLPVLILENSSEDKPWRINFLRMIDMTNDSNFFRTQAQLEENGWILKGNSYVSGEDLYLPLYEAKMIYHYNHRYGDYGLLAPGARGHVLPEVSVSNLKNAAYVPLSRYWIPAIEVLSRLTDSWPNTWLLGWRDVTDARASMRTSVFSLLPAHGVGNTMPLMLFENHHAREVAGLVANLTSFIFDYVTRQKVAGLHLNYLYLKQLPVLKPDIYNRDCKWYPNQKSLVWLFSRIIELTYTAWDLQSFAQECGYHGPPFRWDEERRFLLRCELDAVYFHLYGIERDDVAYIMDTFPIVKRKDEKAHGEYRTKRIILEIYDDMAEAMRTGQPYQTRLDPPPADPRVAHPWDPTFGPEPEQLWEEVERMKDEGGRMKGEASDEATTTIAENSTPYAPTPTPEQEPLILQNPVAEIKKTKKAKATKVAQDTFMEVMPAPTGPRSVRLKRAMALGGDHSPIATRELVAFLADEDSNIRWLAGSSLVQRSGGGAGADTVAAIAAFLDQAGPERVEQAKPEALRVLGLIVETAEADSVRRAAREMIERG